MPSRKAMDSIKTPTDGPSIPSNALVPYTVVFSLTLHIMAACESTASSKLLSEDLRL
jgi:hypothetical protein